MNLIRQELLKQDKICYLCGEEFSNPKSITIDHAIPKVKIENSLRYSINGLENLLLTHNKCNKIKGDNSIFYAVRRLKAYKDLKGDRFFKWVNRL